MLEQKTNITKNTSYLTAALIFQKILSFTYFTFLARELGPENLGQYYLAISFATVFSIIADLGLANVLTREVAKRQGEAKKLLGNVLGLKIPLAIITIIAVLAAIGFNNYSGLMRNLILVSLACVIMDSFTATFYAFFRPVSHYCHLCWFTSAFLACRPSFADDRTSGRELFSIYFFLFYRLEKN
jgi:O-antigen/teichoic acid export membrane protein